MAAKSDRAATMLMRAALAKMSGGFRTSLTPLWDTGKLVNRLATHRDYRLAKREDDGNPVILFACDISGSCSSVSEITTAVARSAVVHGVRGADVWVMHHSNGMFEFDSPYQLWHNNEDVLDKHEHDDLGWRTGMLSDELIDRILGDESRYIKRTRDRYACMQYWKQCDRQLAYRFIMRTIQPTVVFDLTDRDSSILNYALAASGIKTVWLEREAGWATPQERRDYFLSPSAAVLEVPIPPQFGEAHKAAINNNLLVKFGCDSITNICAAITAYATPDQLYRLTIR